MEVKNNHCAQSDRKTTKALAKKLGLIETIYTAGRSGDVAERCEQVFDYLIVVDFESTCWEGSRSGCRQPEIIEFPAVLLNLSNGRLEEEFQQYVMPSENQRLSEFCKELTGISQQQVDAGVPLATCLLLFDRWLSSVSSQRTLVFHKHRDAVAKGEKCCTFVTWSDWDFSSCLHNECRRKQITKPDVFNQWIDLRAAYKDLYKRRPQGLRGALHEVGLQFEGREHSGLCDARNTAHLAWRMACDGAVLSITKTLTPNASTRAARKCVVLEQSSTAEVVTPVRKPLQAVNVASVKLQARRKSLARDATLRLANGERGGAAAATPAARRRGETSDKSRCSYETPKGARRPAPSSSCKKTPPLCGCGRRAARRVASLPGPNQGRRFFCCPNKKSLGMKSSSGCGFFHWDY